MMIKSRTSRQKAQALVRYWLKLHGIAIDPMIAADLVNLIELQLTSST